MSDATTDTTPGAEPASPNGSSPGDNRKPKQIQADIDASQARLAATVDELSRRISPEALAQDAKASVKGVFVEPDGTVKPKPIAVIAGTVAGLVLLRKFFHRG